MKTFTQFSRLSIAVIAVLFVPLSSNAQSRNPSTISDFIKEVLDSNPEILSAKKAFESASARIPQAASLNDPMVDFEYNAMVAGKDLSSNPMRSFSVSQEIPFPTKLYLRAKIASKLAKMAYENYKSKEDEVISNLKNAYSELFLIYKSIEINEESKTFFENLYKSATARYAAGRAEQTDALRAQVELARIDNELIMLEQKRLSTQARLNVLLNKDPSEDLGVLPAELPVEFKRSLKDLCDLAKEHNPKLKAYKYAIERGKLAYKLSLNEFLPDINVKFQQMLKDGRAERGAWAGMIGVTIPLWFFEKQAFGVKEMKSDLEMVRAEYEAQEHLVLFEVNDAFARADANKKLIELYEMAFIPQAQESVGVALKGYEAQRADFTTVLDSQRMLLDFELDRYKAILDFRIALADLERAVGEDIDLASK